MEIESDEDSELSQVVEEAGKLLKAYSQAILNPEF